ncbi:MAG TPA: hypothetical protein VGF45_00885 [Polyangia bacterium]
MKSGKDSERALVVVRGHQPQRVPPEVQAAPGSSHASAGMQAIALVLSTHRGDRSGLAIDHDLWLACLEAVGVTVRASETEVVVPRRRGFFAWLFRRKAIARFTFDQYVQAAKTDDNPGPWQVMYWRKEGQLLAAASEDAWPASAGQSPYQDPFTTWIWLPRAAAARLMPLLQVSVARAGGVIERVVDAASDRRLQPVGVSRAAD